MERKIKSVVLYNTIIVLILIDQILKFIIEINKQKLPINIINNYLRIAYCENIGIAFGLASTNIMIFIICSIVILGIIGKLIINKNSRIEYKTKFILGLIMAGGTGNLIDRIVRGYVIDYIDISELINFPVFNLADILICIGVIAIGISMMITITNNEEATIGRTNSK